MRVTRRTEPFTKWINVLCSNLCGRSTTIRATNTSNTHYCDACRNMMKDPSNDQE